MFLDPSRFPFLAPLAGHATRISHELRQALADVPHVRDTVGREMAVDFLSDQWTKDNGINRDAVGYDLRDGGYSMLAVYKRDRAIDQMDVAAVFPETSRLLAGIPGLHYAAFTALSPGAHLGLHAHTRRHYIFHVLLNDLAGGSCEMICDGQVRVLERLGDTALFDYSLPHETFSHARNTRFNLMIDFLP